MAINLKATARYLNKYEGAHAILSNSTPFFNEDDWVKIAQGNDSSDLDMYIDALSRTDTMDYDKFRKDYDMEFANSETRLAALYNEAYGDREELVKVENEDGTKREISKYDFYKENIVKQNEYLRQQHNEEIDKENNANIFADVGAVAAELGVGLDRDFAGTTAFFKSMLDVGSDYLVGDWDKGFAKWSDYWNASYRPISEMEMQFNDNKTLYDELVEFETDYTHFRDTYGNLTTAGRIFVGAANTAGEMLAASFTGAGLVGLAGSAGSSLGFLASQHAGLINQVVYYAPMAGRSTSETQQQLISSGASYSTAELLTHTLVKTGLEVGIEVALDKMFGSTGLDNWLFGRGTKAALKKSTWLTGLGRVGKDIAQESTEEVLQELSGVLADNVFGLVADENFGELSSFSFQNLVDAAVIAALVSGGHATLSVMKTPGAKIIGEDGSVHEIGKLAAYDYRLNIESFWDAYAEAEKTFTSAMSKDQANYLPSYKRLNSLREQRNFLESEIRKTKTNTTNRLINELAVKSGIDKIQPDTKLSASDRIMLEQQLKSDPEYKSISSMENRMKELDIQISQMESLLSSETLNEKANNEHNRRADKIRKDYAESFTQMYAAAKMLASFSNQIGAERLKQANDILNKSTEYINSGKRNPVEMERRFNEMSKAVKAIGIVIPTKLSTKIKNAKMSKLFKVVKRNGKNSFDVIKQSDKHQTKEELNLERKVLEELLIQHSKCKTVILTDDGTSVANDDESGIIAVPVKELKLGSKAVLDDVAEQMLVDAVVNAKFKGITIDKIADEYKFLHPSFEGDVYTVSALSLFYDSSFFMHMLSVANKDMYSFLSSLIELESSVVEEDAKSSNYKKKMSEAKKSMTYCVVQYLSVNPYADRKLDFLSKEQLKYVDSKLYSRDLMNTYIELGVLSEEIRTYLITKINNVSSYELSAEEKSELIKSLDDLKESRDRRSLVETLNSYYRNVWNYGYDGRTYLPTSTNANKIFNYFCYENGFTCADFMGEPGPNLRDPIENFNERNEMFKAFTGNTYELKITKRYKKDDPASGRFVSSYMPVLGNPSDYMIEIVPIVKERFSLSRAQLNKIGKSDKVKADEDSKDYGFMSGQHKELVDELLSEELSDVDKSFLSINDVISNTNYLSDTIKNKIVKKYGNLTPNNAFLFLKDYFLKKTNGLISLSLSNDNEVFFTDLTAAKVVLSDDEKFTSIMDNLPEATKEGVPLVKISDLVSDEYKTEIMNYSYVYLIDDKDYEKSGKSIYGRFKADDGSVGIYMSKRAMKNLTDFRFTFLHELMHLYQYLNQENLEYGVFSKFKESDRKSLVNSVKKHVPAIFNKRNKNANGKPQSDWEVTKDFLYYCSGASSAFGSEYEDYVKFYPVIVKDNENGTTTVSLPWGKSFTTSASKKSSESVVKTELNDSSKNETLQGNVHLKSKGQHARIYVGKKASKGTNLEPFAGRYLSEDLQGFILGAGSEKYGNIDESLANKIKAGTLTMRDVMDYFYNSDGKKAEDENTFRLINDSIFHNKFIKSFEQLDNYILTRTANYYAMRSLFKSQGLYDLLLDSDNPELYISFMEMLQNNDSTRKKFEQISNRYWSGEIIDEKNLRRLYMRWFDGSVESAGYVAAVARVAAYQAWKTSTDGKISVSLSSSVSPGKNGKSLTMEDVVPSKSDFDDFNRFVTDENSFSRLGKLLEAADHKVVMDAIQEKQSGADISMDEVIKRRDDMSIKINDAYQHDAKSFAELYEQYVSDDEELANALYAQSLIRAATAQEDISSLDEAVEQYDAAQEVAKSLIRPSKNIVNNLRSMSRTIRANLSEKERKLFLKHNSDLFDENLNVKKSVYQDVKDNGTVRLKSEDVLLEIEDRVRQLSKDVRNGLYSGEEFLRYRKRMESKISKILNELAKNASNKVTTVTYELVGEEIVVDTDKEIPFAVKRLLETQITKTAKSTTQLLTNDTDMHVLMNMKTFIESNVEVLNSLTQEDVNEIIDFYMSSDILPNTNRAKLWTTVQQLMLGYLLKMDNNGIASFSLTEEQRSKVEHRLEFMVSTAATLVSTWKNVLNDLNVANEMGKAMLKVCDIELSTENESELIQAIQSGDVDRIRSAKNKAYNSIVNEYKDRKKTIFDKLLRFERMAMLSGPGTWVRNQTSNLLVSANNRLAELVTRMFPQSEKAKKLNQYRIIGTKVNSKYVTFIKNNLLDNGLLELISDGLIKYDTRRSSKVSTENQLLQLIKNKLETELFDNESSKWKSSKLAQKFIMTMMSDKFYINKSMIRYLGKMMTEDNVDVSSGLTTDIMDSIADAYVMAAQDYMHRPNFWTKMEQSFRTYLHKNFNATSADGIYFMYKQIFPFAGASWNWFAEAWNYTPFALAKGIYNLCKLEKTVEQMDEARRKGEVVRSSRFAEYMARRKIGKGAIGTFGLILGAILVATGKAGIDDDDDKYKLKINAADGPIYIDISDVYGSTGIILGMSIGNCFVNDKGEFNYSSFMNLISNSLNVMFLDSSFADLFNSFRSSESFSDYLLDVPTDVASMLVPNFIKTIGNLFKKYNVRYSSGLKGQMERFMINSFGAFSYMMPYKINPYSGDAEIVNDGWFALNLVNKLTPIDVKNYNFSDSEKEAVSLGIRKSQLTGRYEVGENKINLTSKEAEKLNTFYGKLNKQDLYDLMNDKVKYTVESEDGKRVELLYSKMSDKQKAAVIERIMSKNSSYAKIYILTSNYGYKYYASDSEYEELKKLKVNNVYRKVGKYDGFVKD